MSHLSIEEQIKVLEEKLEHVLEHRELEEQFAEEANIRFEKNLACFEKYYPDIAESIANFKTREGFYLHVSPSGHGNIFPKGSEVPLYTNDPLGQMKAQVKRNVENPFLTLTDYSEYNDDDDKRIHMIYMNKLSKFMAETGAIGKEKVSTLPPTFPSGIIFGIGLGYHISLLLEEHSFDYLFLIEPDFELFFASLFCTDWQEIITKVDEAGNCLFFLLGADEETLIKDLEVLAEDIGAFSLVRCFCYQHLPDEKINKLISKWVSDYFRFQYGHGFFNDAITGFAHSIYHVENTVPLLRNWESKRLDLDTPVFIVGNGPSLDEAEKFIKENEKNALVFAAGTAVASLYKKGVEADFHVLVERPYSNYKIFGDILPEEVYKRTNLLGLNTLYPDNVFRYKWTGLAGKGNESGTFLLDLLSCYDSGKGIPQLPYCNPVVANTALSFALFFGFRNIYLFGVDNGNLPCGSHHSKDSIYKQDQSDDSESGYLCMPMQGKRIEGNLGGYVITNQLFLTAHRQLEKLISLYSGSTVYNVGPGAKLKGTHPLNVHELLPISKKIDIEEQVSIIKNDFFYALPNDTISEEIIAINKFEDICDHLVSLCESEIDSREKAADMLKRQERYVYAFRNTTLHHLFHTLRGALLYYHCPLVTLLYTYKDEQFSLQRFHEANKLWKEYILAMKTSYRQHYHEKCDWGKD
jgi:hypothetical protein